MDSRFVDHVLEHELVLYADPGKLEEAQRSEPSIMSPFIHNAHTRLAYCIGLVTLLGGVPPGRVAGECGDDPTPGVLEIQGIATLPDGNPFAGPAYAEVTVRRSQGSITESTLIHVDKDGSFEARFPGGTLHLFGRIATFEIWTQPPSVRPFGRETLFTQSLDGQGALVRIETPVWVPGQPCFSVDVGEIGLDTPPFVGRVELSAETLLSTDVLLLDNVLDLPFDSEVYASSWFELSPGGGGYVDVYSWSQESQFSVLYSPWSRTAPHSARLARSQTLVLAPERNTLLSITDVEPALVGEACILLFDAEHYTPPAPAEDTPQERLRKNTGRCLWAYATGQFSSELGIDRFDLVVEPTLELHVEVWGSLDDPAPIGQAHIVIQVSGVTTLEF